MLKRFLTFAVTMGLLLIAFNAFAETEQGRTIVCDKATKTILIIPNKSGDMQKPDYVLPAVKYSLPDDPAAIDIPPAAGGRMRLDLEKNFVRIYNVKTAAFEEIPIKIVETIKDVTPDNPLVQGKTFPMIDKSKKNITEWSPRQGLISTFTVEDKFFDLPPDVWAAGHEVRIHFTTPGKADRIENLTKAKK